MDIKHKMHPTLETVTPQLAEKWLAFNVDNRPLPEASAKFIAREITAGEFKTTHQAIAFTGNKDNPTRLIDGQTRLTAIIRSGQPVDQWVFWNCPEDTFAVIDSGKVRSFADRHGWTKDRVAFMNIIHWLSGGYSKPLISDADAIMAAFGNQYDAIIEACCATRKRISAAAVRAGCAIVMHQYPDAADRVAAYYRNMVQYVPGSEMQAPPSVRRLYARLIDIVGGGRDAINIQVPLVHKAMKPSNWNADHRLTIGDNVQYLATLKAYITHQLK